MREKPKQRCGEPRRKGRRYAHLRVSDIALNPVPEGFRVHDVSQVQEPDLQPQKQVIWKKSPCAKQDGGYESDPRVRNDT